MVDLECRGLQRIGFILLPGFALMSYAAAIEPLRAANLLAARPLYSIEVFSPDGQPVASSAGPVVPAQPLSMAESGLTMLFICAGGQPADWHFPEVTSCVRRLARKGVRIGGISGGPYVLAVAGILEGYDFTIHWEHAAALVESFHDLRPRQSRFVVDRDRITCGGGIAPLDMMHALVAERMGPDFARRVSDWYLHTHVAASAEPQRASAEARYGVHHRGLLAILEKMENSIERPLNRSSMARLVGMSARNIDRLFSEYLGSTYLTEYRRIRLQHARRLIQQSRLSISEIAFATGFSTAGYFSRSFRKEFGVTPRSSRK